MTSVDMAEFMEYYRNVGSLIDNDEFFSIMVSNVWSLSGGPNPMISYSQGDSLRNLGNDQNMFKYMGGDRPQTTGSAYAVSVGYH